MRNAIITDPGRAYIFGIASTFLSLFLGYLWSPDYLEVVINGYNFLYASIFMIILFIMTWLINKYFENKHDAEKNK